MKEGVQLEGEIGIAKEELLGSLFPPQGVKALPSCPGSTPECFAKQADPDAPLVLPGRVWEQEDPRNKSHEHQGEKNLLL